MKTRKAVRPAWKNEGIVISGQASLKARNLAVGKNSSIRDSSITRKEKQEVCRLLKNLEQEITKLPPELSDQGAKIAAAIPPLKNETEKATPDQPSWKIKGGYLVDAAKSVATVAPWILETAKAVASFFS